MFRKLSTSLRSSEYHSEQPGTFGLSKFEYIGSSEIIDSGFKFTTYNFALHYDDEQRNSGFCRFYDAFKLMRVKSPSSSADGTSSIKDHILLESRIRDLLIKCYNESVPESKDVKIVDYHHKHHRQNYSIVSLCHKSGTDTYYSRVDSDDTFIEYLFMTGQYTIHILKVEGTVNGKYASSAAIKIFASHK